MSQVLADLDRHEGYRFYAYPDPLSQMYKLRPKLPWGFKPASQLTTLNAVDIASGKPWTVGYGYTIGVTPATTQSRQEAIKIMQSHVQTNINELEKAFPEWKNQPFVIQTVLVNMVYNLGIEGLMGFKNTLRYIAGKNYTTAADNLEQSKWAKQVGVRAKELIKRVRTLTIEPEHLVN